MRKQCKHGTSYGQIERFRENGKRKLIFHAVFTSDSPLMTLEALTVLTKSSRGFPLL